MGEKRRNNGLLWILVIIGLVIIIIVFLASFGQIDATKKESDLNLDNRKKLAELRHRKLQSLIDKKKNLQVKLDKRFKFIYLIVRFIFIGLLGLCNWLYCIWHGTSDLNDVITFNEGLLILTFTITFLAFGTIGNLESMLNYFKTNLEIRVFKKYLDIDEQIEKHTKESIELAMLIKEYETDKNI